MTVKEKIDQLRAELHQHNYNYYVLNAPEISDKEFDDLMRELQDLEKEHPEYQDDNSPTMRVGSDLNKNFTQVAHKYFFHLKLHTFSSPTNLISNSITFISTNFPHKWYIINFYSHSNRSRTVLIGQIVNSI